MTNSDTKNTKTHFVVDAETADNFRQAVRYRWGDDIWGKIQDEHKKALDERAKKLFDYFESGLEKETVVAPNISTIPEKIEIRLET